MSPTAALRWIHIIVEGSALLLGPVAMIAAKGGRTRVLAGRILQSPTGAAE